MKYWVRRASLETIRRVPSSVLERIPRDVLAKVSKGLFTGGETRESAMSVLKGHPIALDGSCEEEEREEEWAKNVDRKIELIRFSAERGVPFVAIKPSAFGGFRNAEHFEGDCERLRILATEGARRNVCLMFDAERYGLQRQVSETCLHVLRQLKEPVLLNTYQMYLQEGLARLQNDLESSAQDGFPLGLKLVRGAYINSEPNRSVIHPTKTITDATYNAAVKLVVDHLSRRRDGSLRVMIATHNLESVKVALDALRDAEIPLSCKELWFAQIYGLGETTSDYLIERGCNVARLVVFGRDEQLSGWLLRRIDELRHMPSI